MSIRKGKRRTKGVSERSEEELTLELPNLMSIVKPEITFSSSISSLISSTVLRLFVGMTIYF